MPMFWYEDSYDALSIANKIASEAANAGLTVKEYVDKKIKEWIKGTAKDAVEDVAFNAFINMILKAVSESQSGGYNEDFYLGTEELKNFLPTQESDGWRFVRDQHIGITISKQDEDYIEGGTFAVILYGCTHHWRVRFAKDIEE